MHTKWFGLRILIVLGLLEWSVCPVGAESIGPEGGPAVLTSSSIGRVQMQAPPAVFASKTEVQISVTQSKETVEDFTSTLATRSGRLKRLPGEIRIQAGKSKPKASVKLQIQLPVDLVPATGSLKVMVQLFYEGETEVHDSFDEIDSGFDAATRTLRFELAPNYFTSARGKSGKMEAVVVIVADSGK